MKNKQIEMHHETGSIINEHRVCKCPVTSNLIKLSTLRGLKKKQRSIKITILFITVLKNNQRQKST